MSKTGQTGLSQARQNLRSSAQNSLRILGNIRALMFVVPQDCWESESTNCCDKAKGDDNDVTEPSPPPRTPPPSPPPGAHSESQRFPCPPPGERPGFARVMSMTVSEQSWVQYVLAGELVLLLWAITIPLHKVLEVTGSQVKDVMDCVCASTINHQWNGQGARGYMVGQGT